MSPSKQPPPRFETTSRRARALGLLVLLGATCAGWAQYLWTQLVVSRSGGEAFCAFGESECSSLWDASFASLVHGVSGLPVAAWGVVWGWLALLLPLGALVRGFQGKGTDVFDGAIRWVTLAGAFGLGVLLIASAVEGLFCSSCGLTYLGTSAYLVVAAWGLRPHAPSHLGDGLAAASLTTVVVYLLLLYPGLNTPKSQREEGQRALAALPKAPSSSASPAVDAQLRDLIASLPPRALQSLADSIYLFENSPSFPQETPRALQGPTSAGIRITEFTDALCSHCATLHETLTYLKTILPADAFSVDSRQFPLDGNCNQALQVRGPETVRCVAAQARICLETSPGTDAFASALYARQDALTPELVFEAAAPFLDRPALEACVAAPETARKLASDVAYAWRYQPDGTPLVLVDGRRATSFGPFLYAMALTGGRTDHPALGALPTPNPNAHLH